MKNEVIEGTQYGSNISAHFTIYAYDYLKEKLHGINHLNFLFGELRFIKSLDPDKQDRGDCDYGWEGKYINGT